jgi:hypothetical protein
MAVIYRTDGAWGSGKGTNLAPAEVDGNFYDITQRVTYIEDNPVEPITPIAINIEGGQFTMGLSDGSTLGPITITYPMPLWRGTWAPSVEYNEMDFFTAPDGGLGAVMIGHTSAATFDWGALSGGSPVYQQLVGGSGTTSGISDLIDVALGTQADDDMLVWDGPASLWRNETPTAVVGILPAFGGSTGAAAGAKGVVPAPAAGDDTAGKFLSAGGGWAVPATGSGGSGSLAGLADVSITSPVNLSLLQYNSTDGLWHDASLTELGTGTVGLIETGTGLVGGPITTSGMISLATVPTLNLLANVTGSTAAPAGVSLSTLLDAVIGTERGSVLRRGGTGWTVLAPGADGTFLRSGGPAADITWGTPAGAGTVTTVNSGAGLTGGPITSSGTLSLATVGDNNVLANISGGTAAPGGTALTLLLDHALGATQGMVLYRGATTWAALPAGASGAVLTSGGAAANPSWVSGAGAGTVTNIATGTGLIGGPITTTGTIAFATIANLSVLANISGSTAAPTPSTMSAILDAVFSATRGSVLYRGAAGWAALGAGTAGNVLTTGGAGADPAWAAAAGGASITTSDTPPSSPADGDAWWDSAGGQLYIRYDDGTGSQWVAATNQPGPPGTNANITGLTTGQIPIAGSATSLTSSIPLPLTVAQGGTGATTAAAALTTLGAVAKAGDTMTGTLHLQSNLVLRKATTADSNNIYGNSTGDQTRWVLSLGDSGAESGGNAGTDFNLHRFTDAGGYVGAVLSFSRATGDATIGGNLTITGSTATKPGGGPWVAPSDRSLKSAAAPWHTGLAEVLQLQPIIYRYNNAAWNLEDTDYVGVDAEDAAAIIPEMGRIVSVPADDVVIVDPHAPPGGVPPGHQTVEVAGVEAGPLLWALVNCVKELAARLDQLEKPGGVQ